MIIEMTDKALSLWERHIKPNEGVKLSPSLYIRLILRYSLS